MNMAIKVLGTSRRKN